MRFAAVRRTPPVASPVPAIPKPATFARPFTRFPGTESRLVKLPINFPPSHRNNFPNVESAADFTLSTTRDLMANPRSAIGPKIFFRNCVVKRSNTLPTAYRTGLMMESIAFPKIPLVMVSPSLSFSPKRNFFNFFPIPTECNPIPASEPASNPIGPPRIPIPAIAPTDVVNSLERFSSTD